MPAVQDAVWGAAWQRCLTKLGVDSSSPHWTNMELPSEAAATQAHLDAQTQPNSEAQPEYLLEQTQTDGAITDLTNVAEGTIGNDNPDPNSATVVEGHSEEA